jgi:hypothetical protein
MPRIFEHDLVGKPVPTFPDHALSTICGSVADIVTAEAIPSPVSGGRYVKKLYRFHRSDRTGI